ncbi:PREDICTED: uncharacterized protein LOC108362696 isoform X2 [Rhagoletis zephyria]|uniref:uncharacterized protein LOC118735043 n=1 Tax=Rhagoletis pomonella TaxID=28610 RepID=UPI000811A109|nr:PREDICTED: uncharacterized protein LOC108362696 isoform X2 [Rhagoletis zephyria]XP_036320528.1 uncharacterized protein LOC118735043 [Rhagoletis pomonella]
MMMIPAIVPLRHFLCTQNGWRYLKLIHREGIRKSHVVSYRVVPAKQSKITTVGAEVVGAAMWWWILWHLWHEHEHITVTIYSNVAEHLMSLW